MTAKITPMKSSSWGCKVDKCYINPCRKPYDSKCLKRKYRRMGKEWQPIHLLRNKKDASNIC
jgi:hypothetical protein